jgi:hypothetical protein
LKKWRDNGFLAFIFLGITCIILLFTNYILVTGHQNELDNLHSHEKELDSSFKAKEAELKRLTVYSQVFPYLNKAFKELHNTLRITSEDDKKSKQAFIEFCNKLSYTFSIVTNSECHVCIKILHRKNNTRTHKKIDLSKLEVATFVRDTIGLDRDKIDRMKKFNHYINCNTDFEEIIKNYGAVEDKYFFSNNLPEILDYKSSSFLPHSENYTFFAPNTSIEERQKKWPLSYFSTICVPICPGIFEQVNAETFLGFLCIDSKISNAFNEKIDSSIIVGCADGLYNSLRSFLLTQINKN